MIRYLNNVLFSITLLVISCSASASGSVGYDDTAVDENYEYGKSVFQGRAKGVSKTNYCIDTGTEKVKLKGKVIKSFKNSTYQKLASKLYDCDNPDTLITEVLGQRNTPYVLYFLSKRYKLKLTDG